MGWPWRAVTSDVTRFLDGQWHFAIAKTEHTPQRSTSRDQRMREAVVVDKLL